MFTRSRSKRNLSPAQAAEGISQTLAHGAEEAASRVGGAVEQAGARVAKEAGHARGRVAKEAGQARGRVAKEAGRARDRVSNHPTTDALLKAQLAKTSRELAHESSELGEAVSSLNQVIKANRKAAARGRTRLLGGLALGAALMYHFDPQRGKERRGETARRVSRLTKRASSSGSAQPVA